MTDSASDSTIFDHIMVKDDSIYALGLASSLKSKTLSDITLSLDTGLPINGQGLRQIPSSVSSPDDVLVITAGNKKPTYVWLEDGVLKWLSPEETGAKPQGIKASVGSYTKLAKTYEAHQFGYVLAERSDGAANVLDLKDGQFRISRQFDARVGRWYTRLFCAYSPV